MTRTALEPGHARLHRELDAAETAFRTLLDQQSLGAMPATLDPRDPAHIAHIARLYEASKLAATQVKVRQQLDEVEAKLACLDAVRDAATQSSETTLAVAGLKAVQWPASAER